MRGATKKSAFVSPFSDPFKGAPLEKGLDGPPWESPLLADSQDGVSSRGRAGSASLLVALRVPNCCKKGGRMLERTKNGATATAKSTAWWWSLPPAQTRGKKLPRSAPARADAVQRSFGAACSAQLLCQCSEVLAAGDDFGSGRT